MDMKPFFRQVKRSGVELREGKIEEVRPQPVDSSRSRNHQSDEHCVQCTVLIRQQFVVNFTLVGTSWLILSPCVCTTN